MSNIYFGIIAYAAFMLPCGAYLVWLERRDHRKDRAAAMAQPPAGGRPALPQRPPYGVFAQVEAWRAEDECPIFSDLAAERLAAELADDEAIARWLA